MESHDAWSSEACEVVMAAGAVLPFDVLSFARSELSTCVGASAQLRRCQRFNRVPALVDLPGEVRFLLPADALADVAASLRAGFGSTVTTSSRRSTTRDAPARSYSSQRTSRPRQLRRTSATARST
jgi:hypothetical protein